MAPPLPDPDQKTTCHKCEKTFLSWKGYHLHKLRSPRHITCPICSVDFRTQDAYKKHHDQSHAAEQNLPCPGGCDEIFTRIGGLINHIEQSLCPGNLAYRERRADTESKTGQLDRIRAHAAALPPPSNADYAISMTHPLPPASAMPAPHVSTAQAQIPVNMSRAQGSSATAPTVPKVAADDSIIDEDVLNTPWDQAYVPSLTGLIPAGPCFSSEDFPPLGFGPHSLANKISPYHMVMPHRKFDVNAVGRVNVKPNFSVNATSASSVNRPTSLGESLATFAKLGQSFPGSITGPSTAPTKPPPPFAESMTGLSASLAKFSQPLVPSKAGASTGVAKAPQPLTTSMAGPSAGSAMPPPPSFAESMATLKTSLQGLSSSSGSDLISGLSDRSATPEADRIAQAFGYQPKPVSTMKSAGHPGMVATTRPMPPAGPSAGVANSLHSTVQVPGVASSKAPAASIETQTAWERAVIPPGVSAWTTMKNLFPDAPAAVAPPAGLLAKMSVNDQGPVGHEFGQHDPNDPTFKPGRYFVGAIGKFKCPHRGCTKSMDNQSSFIMHLKSVAHGGEALRLKCPHCLRYFDTATALTQHAESQSVRCTIRKQDQYGVYVEEITASTAAVDGVHSDNTVKYVVNQTITAETGAPNAAERVAIANSKFLCNDHIAKGNYWHVHKPKW